MAYTFNGTNSYLNAGTNSTFQLGTAFSCAVLIYPTDVASFREIAQYYTYPGGVGAGWQFRITQTSSLQLVTSSAPTDSLATGGTVTGNQWQHTAFTWNNGSGSLYVGGANVASQSSMVFPSYSSPELWIGSLNFSGPTFTYQGAMAEFATWNATLTDAEIAALAAGFTADQIRPQSLQFYAPLIRDLVDLRAGRSITNVNGATVSTHPRIIQ
jgi:hypothetical protein